MKPPINKGTNLSINKDQYNELKEYIIYRGFEATDGHTSIKYIMKDLYREQIVLYLQDNNFNIYSEYKSKDDNLFEITIDGVIDELDMINNIKIKYNKKLRKEKLNKIYENN